ncbi:MAG: DPP IV N-terminal domain-containing protein [Planctomycetota bacterium]|nr:DPP IV N-terminal domain-containing protein [Planctomycetota bacterium]
MQRTFKAATIVWVSSAGLLALPLTGCTGTTRAARAPQPTPQPDSHLAADEPASIPAGGTVLAIAAPGQWMESSDYNAGAPAPAGSGVGLFGEVTPGAAAPADDPAENLRQFSFATEGADFDPALAPDGSMLYFASTAHRASPDIYVKSVDGRSVTQLTNDPASDIMPAVSPDGSRIAFASNRGGSWDLWIMNATGGQAVQVTSDSTHELRPSWSSDGKMLAFCRLGEVSNRWEIWVTDAAQAGVQKFLTFGLFPSWHPTENRIVFQRGRDRGERLFSIWTLDYNRGEATRLTELVSSPTAALINPQWSPDGQLVAFTSVPNPGATPSDQLPASADVWIVNAAGGGQANLTGGRFANLSPTWGPNNSLYFVSDRGGRQHVWGTSPHQAVVAFKGGGPAPTQHARTNQAPAAPDHHSAPTNPHAASAQGHHSGADPAHQPAEPNQDTPPELANVPIDDQHR